MSLRDIWVCTAVRAAASHPRSRTSSGATRTAVRVRAIVPRILILQCSSARRSTYVRRAALARRQCDLVVRSLLGDQCHPRDPAVLPVGGRGTVTLHVCGPGDRAGVAAGGGGFRPSANPGGVGPLPQLCGTWSGGLLLTTPRENMCNF